MAEPADEIEKRFSEIETDLASVAASVEALTDKLTELEKAIAPLNEAIAAIKAQLETLAKKRATVI
jgi:septal ring factor EnvC (AmiA/AmiB activator)